MKTTVTKTSLVYLAIAAWTIAFVLQAHADQCAQLDTQWHGCNNPPGNGDKVWVVNMRKDHTVRATVHHHGYYHGNTSDWDQVITIPAGGRTFVGCTGSPSNNSAFSVVGCEVL
jgi:hypothetical protein